MKFPTPKDPNIRQEKLPIPKFHKGGIISEMVPMSYHYSHTPTYSIPPKIPMSKPVLNIMPPSIKQEDDKDLLIREVNKQIMALLGVTPIELGDNIDD